MTSAASSTWRTGDYLRFTRTDGGATIAPEEHLDAEAAVAREGDAFVQAAGGERAARRDRRRARRRQLPGRRGARRCCSAPRCSNFGVRDLLDTLVDLAPPPAPPTGRRRRSRARIDAPFSAFVFKVQAGMDAAHRDRLAFVRVCSGRLRARHGGHARHAPAGPFATKYAQQVFGRERDEHRPGLPRRRRRPGQRHRPAASATPCTSTSRSPSRRSRPSRPEHFAVVPGQGHRRYKQFRRGIEQLDHEGVVQVLRSDRRGDQAPVLAAVGPDAVRGGRAPDGARVRRPGRPSSGSPTPSPGAPTRPPRRR